MVNCLAMHPTRQAAALGAQPIQPAADDFEPLDLTTDDVAVEPAFDPGQWAESQSEERGAGGRQVLGTALIVLAVLWVAYTAWSAGRALAGQALSSPAVAQWVALAAGPLALLGLIWLTFGRTRRKEAERFTRSVVTMRAEARSLEALLEVLSQRISDSRSELTMIARHLMELGDQATGKLGGITREFDLSTERLTRHGEALDRAAESARSDMAVLLEDLPRAESTARSLAEHIRLVGSESADKAATFGSHIDTLAERTRQADQMIADSTDRLAVRLAEIERAGADATGRVMEAEGSFSGVLDALLDRTSVSLQEIRSGIDAQAAAVAALVDQASAGIGKAASDSAEALGR